MDVKGSTHWLVDGLAFRLAPLDHRDLDDLYRKRLLPMVGPLERIIGKVVLDGGLDEDLADGAVHRCLESFWAILTASLRKAQPWLADSEAASIVAIYCGDEDDREGDATLYRQVQVVGKSTLERLVSQHRRRLAELVSLAETFEAVITRNWNVEN